MKRGNKYVFDTSAIFCLKDNEDGASKLEDILREAVHHKCQILISFMSLMEFLYVSIMELGEEEARRSYLQLFLLPIITMESDEETGILAAELKANNNISVADSWIAAVALKTNSILVHKDPEFESVGKIVKCLALPYK